MAFTCYEFTLISIPPVHGAEPGDDGAKSNPADAQSQPAAGETDVRMESNRKLSRKQLLKLMKQKNAKRTKNKAKRLGGRKSHSKW